MTRGRARLIGSVMAAAVLWAAPAGAQVTAGQVDDFEDGTTEGWIVGGAPGVVHPTPPANVASGGPAGAADNYLRLTAIGGGGPGSRLSAYNGSQWTGDYLAAGITGISMDLRNFGPDEVTLRLLLLAGPFGPMGPANIAVTTTGVTLSPGGTWTSAFFPLTMPGALNVLVGTAAGALSNAVELRLFHNPIPVFGGPGGNSSPAVTTTVGVDNVRAVSIAAVPEPSTVMLLGTGALLLAGVARARRRG